MRKDYILSISDNTIYSTFDQESAFDLEHVRSKLRGSFGQALGDNNLEPIEILAVPLYTLDQEIDVTQISIRLFDEVGLQDWPLRLTFSDFAITKQPGSGDYFITANIKPDILSCQTIEHQFLKNVKLLPYPPVKLFKVSKTGMFKADRIYSGVAKWPGNLQTRVVPLEVQVKNILLLTEFQAFKLKLAGTGVKSNNLQWHDISLIPRGSRLSDSLYRFRDWGSDGRHHPAALNEGEMTEKQANSKLGQMCPWLLGFQFKEEWADLSSQKVEIVSTPGVISRSQKILSLVDKDRTVRLLQDSIIFHLQQDPAGTSQYLQELFQITEEEAASQAVLDAVDTLAACLQTRRQPVSSTRELRYSELGLTSSGELQRRTTGGWWNQPGASIRNGNGNRIRLPAYMIGATVTRNIDEKEEDVKSDAEESLCWDPNHDFRLGSYAGQGPDLGASPGLRVGVAPVQQPPRAPTVSARDRRTTLLLTPKHIRDVESIRGYTFLDPRAKWANIIQLPDPNNLKFWRLLSTLFGRYTLENADQFKILVQDVTEFTHFMESLGAVELKRFQKNFGNLIIYASTDPDFDKTTFIDSSVKINENKIPEKQFVREARSYINFLGALVLDELQSISQDLNDETAVAQADRVDRRAEYLTPGRQNKQPPESVSDEIVLLQSWENGIEQMTEDQRAGRRVDVNHVTTMFNETTLNVPENKDAPADMEQYNIPRFYKMITRDDTWKLLREIAMKIAAARFSDDESSPQEVLTTRDFLNAFVFLGQQKDVTASISQELGLIENNLREALHSHAVDIHKLIKSAREAGDEAEARNLEQDLVKYVVRNDESG